LARNITQGIANLQKAAFAAFLLLTLLVCALSAVADSTTDPWSDALATRDLEAIEHLLDNGQANPNRPTDDGKTALMFAAQQADADVVVRLLAAGADVNVANANGGTPLMYAALGGDASIAGLLLDGGARHDAKAKLGWTALALAAVKGYDEVVRTLLDAGADQSVRDAYGWTPLMRAAHNGRGEIVRLLLDAPGADLSARQEGGATALHIAAGTGAADIVGRSNCRISWSRGNQRLPGNAGPGALTGARPGVFVHRPDRGRLRRRLPDIVALVRKRNLEAELGEETLEHVAAVDAGRKQRLVIVRVFEAHGGEWLRRRSAEHATAVASVVDAAFRTTIDYLAALPPVVAGARPRHRLVPIVDETDTACRVTHAMGADCRERDDRTARSDATRPAIGLSFRGRQLGTGFGRSTEIDQETGCRDVRVMEDVALAGLQCTRLQCLAAGVNEPNSLGRYQFAGRLRDQRRIGGYRCAGTNADLEKFAPVDGTRICHGIVP
jgi:hypothetical protein